MQIPGSARVDVHKLAAVFGDVTNSYKFYWLLSILDSLQERQESRMSMQDLSLRMLARVWYPLDFFKLSFGKQDSFKSVAARISTIIQVDNRPSAPNLYAQLRAQLSPEELAPLVGATRRLLDWVPYRFIRPFFALETRGLPDQRVNALVTQLTNGSFRAPYRIEGDFIKLHEPWRDYFQEHQLILRAYTQWHIVRFLQKHNPHVIGLPQKLEKPGPEQRKLATAKRFWQSYLANTSNLACIYSGQEVNLSNMSLDHFLPWSYVVHDLLWNIVPVPKAVNSAKSDWLPAWEYFPGFAKLQYAALSYHLRQPSHERLLEDYSLLLAPHFRDLHQLSFAQFEEQLAEQILPQLQMAQNLGFVYPFTYSSR